MVLLNIFNNWVMLYISCICYWPDCIFGFFINNKIPRLLNINDIFWFLIFAVYSPRKTFDITCNSEIYPLFSFFLLIVFSEITAVLINGFISVNKTAAPILNNWFFAEILVAINTSDSLKTFLVFVSIYILYFYGAIVYDFIISIFIVNDISDLTAMRCNGDRKRLNDFIYNLVTEFDCGRIFILI